MFSCVLEIKCYLQVAFVINCVFYLENNRHFKGNFMKSIQLKSNPKKFKSKLQRLAIYSILAVTATTAYAKCDEYVHCAADVCMIVLICYGKPTITP